MRHVKLNTTDVVELTHKLRKLFVVYGVTHVHQLLLIELIRLELPESKEYNHITEHLLSLLNLIRDQSLLVGIEEAKLEYPATPDDSYKKH